MLFFSFGIALVVSILLVPTVARLAEARGWTSPSLNRLGKHPAMSGGLTVSFILTALMLLFEGPGSFADLCAFWVGFLAVLALGLIDDLRGLGPLSKLLLQILSAMATVFLLAQEGRIPSQPLHLGLLTLWIVAIINAWNLLDNMDGLVGGVGAIACLTIAIGFLPSSSAAVESLLMVVLAGSLLGFLVHNFSPASVYLGDTGTHVLGFTLATVPLYSMDLREPDWYHSVVLLTMLLVPIGDTGFVAIRRILGNRPLYVGGKDHSSHWLLSQGYRERQVALIFYCAALGCSLLACLPALARIIHKFS